MLNINTNKSKKVQEHTGVHFISHHGNDVMDTPVMDIQGNAIVSYEVKRERKINSLFFL